MTDGKTAGPEASAQREARSEPPPAEEDRGEAHEAARRIVDKHDRRDADMRRQYPGSKPSKPTDALLVARALLSSPRVEERMRFALERAAEQFAFYGREHREKARASRGNGLTAAADSADSKALTNETFAALCRSALSLQVE